MTDHITPPRELMEQWASEKSYDERDWLYEFHIATRAAQWGADRELEACCELLARQGFDFVDALRAARRAKPLSLKEQALAVLEEEPEDAKELIVFDTDQIKIIRRALEALPE